MPEPEDTNTPEDAREGDAKPKGGPKEFRDELGRFLPGYAGGPGGARRKLSAEYRAAVDNACTPKDLEEIMRALVREALAGNERAAAIVLDRVIGKARPAGEEAPIAIDLGALRTPADLERAAMSVLGAVLGGFITPDQGAALSGLVETVRRTVETRDLADRIARLEEVRHGSP